VLLFGDSQTAGDGVANADRYGDRLERTLPQIEVYNFGLPGSGTDQQYLAYRNFAPSLEHDLVVLGLYVENIGRVASRFRPYVDDRGRLTVYAKPYYLLEDGALTLYNVPVPKEALRPADLSSEEGAHVDWGVPYHSIRKILRTLGLRDLMQRVTHFQPVPDYGKADNPRWLLLSAVVEQWVRSSSAPFLLVPIPMFPFIEGTSDPSGYQARFAELATAAGCQLHDPLPDMQTYSATQRRAFRFADGHLTPSGHEALARSLAPIVEQMADGRTEV